MAKGERPMVPAARPTSYYGRPIIKEPVWRWPIPAYLFTGGPAAGSALLGFGPRLRGDDTMARRASVSALGAVGLSTGFLVKDLGRPERFANMLRVAKPTSPMSTGSWILAGFAPAAGVAAVTNVAGALVTAGGRRRWAAVAGAAALTVGTAAERFAVFEAGRQSARDPKYMVGPQPAGLARSATSH
jgi:formate-dependent nitrite reductase membrane component NrfD